VSFPLEIDKFTFRKWSIMSEVFRPKQYRKVQSEKETSDLLKQYGEKARIIAGGTGIYEIAHRGLLSEVEVLIDISGLDLNYIRTDDRYVHIGASTTMSSIFENRHLLVYPELAALYDALREIQPLQVKNVATIAGAICTALPFFDLPVSLIAMGAEIIIAPYNRALGIYEFIQGYFSVDLRSEEFVREIRIPLFVKNEIVGSAFRKFGITGDDWALVNCGASLKLDGEVISDIKLCFGGGIGEKPKRVDLIEKTLHGVRANDVVRIKSVLEENIGNELETVSDIRASSEYRLLLAKVLGRRTLVSAIDVARNRAK
jgi:aerobic carbon-monoxide dehydrogenase medium subunit